jgi:adenylylsulfate kinase
LYKKARLGEIRDFTGIDSPYEVPEKPDLIVDTKKLNINDSVEKLFHYIVKKIPIS